MVSREEISHRLPSLQCKLPTVCNCVQPQTTPPTCSCSLTTLKIWFVNKRRKTEIHIFHSLHNLFFYITYGRKHILSAGSARITTGLRALQRLASLDAAADGAGTVKVISGGRADIVINPARVQSVVQRWREITMYVVAGSVGGKRYIGSGKYVCVETAQGAHWWYWTEGGRGRGE